VEEEKGISLDTLNQGAAVERFNLALQEVLDNIQDPNTNPKAARAVTLKCTFKPDEDRGLANIIVDVVPKLAPIAPFGVRVFMGRDKNGKGYASEEYPMQPSLPGTEKPAPNVYKLEKKEAQQ
jgi:hypothetical protein